MKVCLLTTGLGRSDVPLALVDHVPRLIAAHGVELTVALTERAGQDFEDQRLAGAAVAEVDDLLDERFDVALAASWRACVHVFRVSAGSHALYVADFEHHRYASWEPERIAAALVYDLPLDLICEARWIAASLGELRPEARCALAMPGVDGAGLPPPAPRPGGPLRVFVGADGAEVSGAVLEAMTEPHELVADVDDADVVASLAQSDGVVNAAREAFRRGATCVVARLERHEELVRHRWNGLVADPDDVRGAARWLDLLARDHALLRTLQTNALETARGWPDKEAAAAALHATLAGFASEPRGPGSEWPMRLMGDAIAHATTLRGEVEARDEAIRRLEAELAAASPDKPRRARWRGRP